MKKLIFLCTLFISLNTFGQTYKANGVTFYGVDYSQARIFGASESYASFKEAFHGINMLFITEASKYDVPKYLHVDVSAVDLEPVEVKAGQINPDELFTISNQYKLTDDQIQDAVSSLPLKEVSGTGLVILAELLNKSDGWGTYTLVYFDIETREVLDAFDTGGKAKGFGLRNYWARSVLEGMKKMK